MKILLIGPQGSGKGTQAKIISAKFGIPHVCTGDLLRESSGELREKIDSYIVGGNLIPDELMLEILKKRVDKADCKNGFILDGFPRNLKQKEMLDGIVKFDIIIEIHISDEEAVSSLESFGEGSSTPTVLSLPSIVVLFPSLVSSVLSTKSTGNTASLFLQATLAYES